MQQNIIKNLDHTSLTKGLVESPVFGINVQLLIKECVCTFLLLDIKTEIHSFRVSV